MAAAASSPGQFTARQKRISGEGSMVSAFSTSNIAGFILPVAFVDLNIQNDTGV